MTIDEAIKHCMDIAETQEMCSNGKKCAKEHRQLAEWLEDYKRQTDMLDKIKEEILDICCDQYCENPLTAGAVREMILEIIDKYKAGDEE